MKELQTIIDFDLLRIMTENRKKNHQDTEYKMNKL